MPLSPSIVVTAVDAETDKPPGLLAFGGKTVAFSVVIVPVKFEPGGVDDAIRSLASASANVPPADEWPADGEKALEPTSEFSAAFQTILTSIPPRLYRVDGARTIAPGFDPETAGWVVGAVPYATDKFSIEPVWKYISKTQVGAGKVAFTFFANDLSILAKEVLELRAKAKAFQAGVEAQWGGESAATWDMVHNYVENTLWPPKDEDLKAGWIDDYSWAVLDYAIPAREFDLLIERRKQIMAVIQEVPWPDVPWFARCSYGVPVTIGKDGRPLGLLNWRLCTPTFSDFFPISTAELKTALGTLWLANLADIYACIVKKAEHKAEEAARSMKFWKVTSAFVGLVLLPTPATVATTVTDLVAYQFLQNKDPKYLAALNLAVGLVVSIATGGSAVSAAPIAAQAYQKAVEVAKQVIESQGVKELQELLEASKAISAASADTAALAGLFEAANRTVEELLSSPEGGATLLAQLIDAKKAGAPTTEIIRIALGLADLPPSIGPFVLWCLAVSGEGILLAATLDLVSSLFGLLGNEGFGSTDPQADIMQPYMDSVQGAGVQVPGEVQALVNGEDPDFPQQAIQPLSIGGAAAGSGILLLVGGLGYLLAG